MEPDGLGDSAGMLAFFCTTGSFLESGVALFAAEDFAFEISLDAAFGGGV